MNPNRMRSITVFLKTKINCCNLENFFQRDLWSGSALFYYMKYIILVGWPVLYFGLDYKPNFIMHGVWFYCFVLMIKDFILVFFSKKP